MARSTMLILLFGLVVLGYLGWRANPLRQPVREELTEADAEVGRFIFERSCDECHGPAASASRLTNYTGDKRTFMGALDDHSASSPALTEDFDERERESLWAYVLTLRGAE